MEPPWSPRKRGRPRPGRVAMARPWLFSVRRRRDDGSRRLKKPAPRPFWVWTTLNQVPEENGMKMGNYGNRIIFYTPNILRISIKQWKCLLSMVGPPKEIPQWSTSPAFSALSRVRESFRAEVRSWIEMSLTVVSREHMMNLWYSCVKIIYPFIYIYISIIHHKYCGWKLYCIQIDGS